MHVIHNMAEHQNHANWKKPDATDHSPFTWTVQNRQIYRDKSIDLLFLETYRMEKWAEIA